MKTQSNTEPHSVFAELLLNAREIFNLQVPCYCNLSPAQKSTNYMITVKLLFQFLSKKTLNMPSLFLSYKGENKSSIEFTFIRLKDFFNRLNLGIKRLCTLYLLFKMGSTALEYQHNLGACEKFTISGPTPTLLNQKLLCNKIPYDSQVH